MTVARKGERSRRKPLALDAYLSFVIFVVVGVATWRLDQLVRLPLMWLALLALALAYGAGRRIQLAYGFSDVGRGVLAGLIISLPVLMTARDFLLATSERLFPGIGTLGLFWALVLILPLIEALYFRGFVQREKGLWVSVLLYGAATGMYYLPSTLGGYAPVLAALVGGMALLGLVYSYVRIAYGFGASLACQGTVHFVLFILPFLSQELAALLG